MRLLIALLATSVLLTGCATAPSGTGTDKTDISPLEQAHAVAFMGRFSEAARQFMDVANQSTLPQEQARATLFAAHALLLSGLPDQAEQTYLAVSPDGLNNQDLLLSDVVLAELAIARGHAQQAQALLLSPVTTLPTWQQRRVFQLRAQLNREDAAYMAALRDLTRYITLIQEADQAEQAYYQLADTLSQITDTELVEARRAARGDWAGWLDAFLLVRSTLRVGSDPVRTLNDWKSQHPLHPINVPLLSAQMDILSIESVPVTQVAVLLPEQERLAVAASAVRQGIEYAWYGLPVDQRPQLRFYASDAEDIELVYQRAVADGASHIIGPLDKDRVQRLAMQTQLPVPTLALNRVDQTARELYQFGLLPEHEAQSVAQQARIDGFSRALIVAPRGEWGDRLYSAFKQEFESLGGTVVYDASVDPISRDFSVPLRRMLGLDLSERRHRQLQQILSRSLAFTAHRRHDVDMIFMAARPELARQIKPQLDFYEAHDLPVYATSHVYSGIADEQADRDLSGVRFCDAPWMIESNQRPQVDSMLPTADGALGRLFALGHDSLWVLPKLASLRQQGALQASTGVLSLRQDGMLMRKLSCTRFAGGKPVLLMPSEQEAVL